MIRLRKGSDLGVSSKLDDIANISDHILNAAFSMPRYYTLYDCEGSLVSEKDKEEAIYLITFQDALTPLSDIGILLSDNQIFGNSIYCLPGLMNVTKITEPLTKKELLSSFNLKEITHYSTLRTRLKHMYPDKDLNLVTTSTFSSDEIKAIVSDVVNKVPIKKHYPLNWGTLKVDSLYFFKGFNFDDYILVKIDRIEEDCVHVCEYGIDIQPYDDDMAIHLGVVVTDEIYLCNELSEMIPICDSTEKHVRSLEQSIEPCPPEEKDNCRLKVEHTVYIPFDSGNRVLSMSIYVNTTGEAKISNFSTWDQEYMAKE